MKGLITYSIAIFTIFLAILSCQKQVDYGPDITQLKSDVASLKSSITSITAQLTNLEASLKAKIDLTNAKIDTINTSINTLNTKTITGLSADILAINSSIINTNKETTRRLDSIRTAILKIDTLVGVNTASASTLSDSYSKLLTNYVTLLKIVQTTTIITEISGSVFKGSFIRGSLLNFYELDTNLNQTGRSFNTTIDDDYGNFDIKAQNLAGKLIRVVGDGFYWNEVLNENSSSRITLTAICKIDSNETVNVNVLTQLERPRVEYLYSVKKLSFDSAKTQAVTEVLKAFGYTNTGIKRAEKVGVVGIGDGSKILLAVSTLMQGFRTESEVTQIMSDFSNDLKKDGTLDDVTIGNSLATHLYYLDTATVLNNFKTKYKLLYNADTVNSIDMRFVKNFQNNTSFSKDKELIEFPEKDPSSNVYQNILNAGVTTGTNIDRNAVSCKINRKGIKLRIEILNENNSDLTPGTDFYIAGDQSKLWLMAGRGIYTFWPDFTTSDLGTYTVPIDLLGSKRFKINFYERGFTIPTKSKIFTVR
jgi:hypothetical protein